MTPDINEAGGPNVIFLEAHPRLSLSLSLSLILLAKPIRINVTFRKTKRNEPKELIYHHFRRIGPPGTGVLLHGTSIDVQCFSEC